jgi:hypothetical protein
LRKIAVVVAMSTPIASNSQNVRFAANRVVRRDAPWIDGTGLFDRERIGDA